MRIFQEIKQRLGNPVKPSELVVLRNDHLGDLILTLPLLRQASEWLGNRRVTVVLNGKYDPLINRVDVSVKTVHDPGRWLSLAQTLAETRADTLVIAASKTRNELAGQWSGIPQRLGFGYKPSMIFHTDPLFIHRKNPPIHEAEFCLEYLRKFPGAPNQPPELPAYQSTEEDKRKANQVLQDLNLENKDFLVVHPGHSGSAEHCQPHQYRGILSGLQENHKILLTGKGPEERRLLNRLRESLPNVHVTPSDLDLPVFARVIALSKLYIGGSSGPLHLASVVGTPRVGLYSNDPRFQPAKWKPLGEKQRIITPPPGKQLSELSPTKISEEVEGYLRKI